MKKLIAIALVLMLCISALSISAFAAGGTVTVYAKVLDGWTNVGAYTWSPEDLGGWPGSKMTLGSDGWYKITMPGTHTTLIINSDQGQTVDLTIEAGKDVWVTVTNEKNGNNYKANVSYDGGSTVAPPPAAPTGYFVAGTGALCGAEWDCAAEANKMTESNGIYVKSYTGVAAGNYSLKVTDGTWTNSWGGNGENGNYDLTVAENNSTVTVKFNPADNTVTVEVNGANAGGNTPAPAPTFDAYYVAGTAALCNGKEWDAGAAENLMTKGDDGIWTITYTNVPAGEYEIKVTAGSWENNWGANATPNGDNVKFTLEEAGDITVKFNPNTCYINVYNGENPLTGDMNLAGIGIALLAATAGVVALVGKKKEF